LRVVQIKVPVPVPFADPDERLGIVLQKYKIILRLNIFFALFFKQGLDKIAGTDVILVHLHMVLVAVQYSNVNVPFARSPGHTCQVLVGGFAGLQKFRFPCTYIVNPKRNLMTGHACHRVLDVIEFCHPGINIHHWIITYHGLILAIKCQVVASWRPEGTSTDPKLIAVHRLPVDDARFLIVGDLNLSAFESNIEVVIDGICQRIIKLVEVGIAGLFRIVIKLPDLVRADIINVNLVSGCEIA